MQAVARPNSPYVTPFGYSVAGLAPQLYSRLDPRPSVRIKFYMSEIGIDRNFALGFDADIFYFCQPQIPS
jgi:hypothetical protein